MTEKIPKIIHYCWFGQNELSKKSKENIAGWQMLNPDFKIIRWNERNFDINSSNYTATMYSEGKLAFVSDYVRLFALYKYGGVYFDTDVQLLKSLDNKLLNLDSFIAQEDTDLLNSGPGIGSAKESQWIKDILKIYDNYSGNDDWIENRTCVEITTRYFNKLGFYQNSANKPTKIKDVTIFPMEYFCPQLPGTKRVKITNKTYSWHHYDYSWKDNKINFIYLKNRIRHFLIPIFGRKFFNAVRELYRKKVRKL